MSREANIFYNLVYGENSFTELFTNLFQFQVFLKFFEGFVSDQCQIKLPIIKYEDFSTQNWTDGLGIPDMIIENEKTIIIIENKLDIGTHLTGHQPESYLELISDEEYEQRIRVLLFIIPRRYFYETELENRSTVYLKTSKVDITFKIIYWEDLIREFYKLGLSEVNTLFDHFYKFAENWFPLTKIKFLKPEIDMIINNTVIETLSKLMEIVRNVSKRLTKKQGISPHFTSNQNEYAIYIRDSEGNDVLYFGIWYPFWKQHNYPFAIAVDQKDYQPKYVEKFKIRFPNFIRDNSSDPEDWLVVGIDIQLFSSENCEEEILLFITNVLDYLMS